jgi:6-phosphogluconolactonase
MPARTPPDLTVMADAAALAEAAAQRIVARLAARNGPLAVCLTGGSTPDRLYALLATERFRSVLPWPRIHWFWTDDRFVPQHDPRSNAGAARRLMLDRVPVPPENIHAVPGDAASVDEAAQRYDSELRHFSGADRPEPARPLFDVVLMGVGSDGHVASLFPGRPELDEMQRWAVGVAEAGLEPFVPRVTLTFPALASTREMVFLVSGAGKREVMARILAGEDLPATRAWSDGEMVWLVDRDALPQRRGLEGA